MEAPFGRDKVIVGDPERRERIDVCFEEESKRRTFLFAHSCSSPFLVILGHFADNLCICHIVLESHLIRKRYGIM